MPDEEREHEQQQELRSKPGEQAVDRTREETRRGQRHRDEPERLGNRDECRTEPATPGAGESQHPGDDEILENENREDEIGLVVGESLEVDQPLHRNGTRRDIDRGGHDQGREREAERDQADEQADPGIHDEVERAAEQDVAATPQKPVEAELEPEEEEQEDDPELGDEGRHLRRLDEAEHSRLIRPEQEPRQQVGRDRRKAEAPGNQTEHSEHGNGDRELAERERRRRGERQSAPILRR